MGEVWRVQDTKLGRKVAIKSLPEAFAKDPQLLPSGEWKLFSSRHGPAHPRTSEQCARSATACAIPLRHVHDSAFVFRSCSIPIRLSLILFASLSSV